MILKTSSEEFLAACENPESTELESVIVDLPKPHRNTLAYLFLHFKRVFEKSQINGLTPLKIAPKVISILMRVNLDTANSEKYVNAFVRLLNLDNPFYERVIEEDAQEPNTPVSRSGSRVSSPYTNTLQLFTIHLSELCIRQALEIRHDVTNAVPEIEFLLILFEFLRF